MRVFRRSGHVYDVSAGTSPGGALTTRFVHVDPDGSVRADASPVWALFRAGDLD